MCRSIKTLRPPYEESVTPDDVEAAALQYVRKVAGMRQPAAANREAFDSAVHDVAAATQRMLEQLVVRGARHAAATARNGDSQPGAPLPAVASPQVPGPAVGVVDRAVERQ